MRLKPKAFDILTNHTGSKSCFSSVTFWAVFFLVVEGVAAHLETALSDGQVAPGDVFSIIRIVAAAIAGCIGRYSASEIIYTPGFLPGRSKSEVEELLTTKNESLKGL